MKYEIMMGIFLKLLSNKSVSAKSLSEKYGVSVRTIYRYMQAIEEAGVPIYTVRGNGGGFALIDTYRLNSTFMSKKEFKKVIETLTAITNEVPDKDLDSAIEKLKAVSKNEYSGFALSSGNLVIDGGSWGDTLGYKSKLKVISDSIENLNELEINYHDRNGKVSKRIIHPHVLVFKQGIWYVYAYCTLRNTFRFFKVGRIESANVLKSTFTKLDIKNEDLPLSFWEQSETCNAVFSVKDKFLSDVIEWLGIENLYKENGKNYFKVTLPYDDGLVMKIMGFGSGITVIEPQELKNKIKAQAKLILEE